MGKAGELIAQDMEKISALIEEFSNYQYWHAQDNDYRANDDYDELLSVIRTALSTRATLLASQEAEMEALRKERDANGEEAFMLRNQLAAARTEALKWLGLYDKQEARALAAEARVAEEREAILNVVTESRANLERIKREAGSFQSTGAYLSAVERLKENEKIFDAIRARGQS